VSLKGTTITLVAPTTRKGTNPAEKAPPHHARRADHQKRHQPRRKGTNPALLDQLLLRVVDRQAHHVRRANHQNGHQPT